MLAELERDGAFDASLSSVDDKDVEGGYYLWDRETLERVLNADELRVAARAWRLGRDTAIRAWVSAHRRRGSGCHRHRARHGSRAREHAPRRGRKEARGGTPHAHVAEGRQAADRVERYGARGVRAGVRAARRGALSGRRTATAGCDRDGALDGLGAAGARGATTAREACRTMHSGPKGYWVSRGCRDRRKTTSSCGRSSSTGGGAFIAGKVGTGRRRH